MKKDTIIITGGAGFVGTNLINYLLIKTKYKIISLDNYSSGYKKNHIKNKRVKYIKCNTINIDKIIRNPKKLILFFTSVNFQELSKFPTYGRVYKIKYYRI